MQKFLRKAFIMEASGFTSDSSLHDAIKERRFPPPDAYLGPRTPVWLEGTFEDWQKDTLARPQTPQGIGRAKGDQEAKPLTEPKRPRGRPRKVTAAAAGAAT